MHDGQVLLDRDGSIFIDGEAAADIPGKVLFGYN